MVSLVLSATNTLEIVKDIATHIGCALSTTLEEHMLDSIRVKQSEYQATLGLTNLTAAAFDNCKLKLNTTQPTDLHSDTFESITTALFYQL